MSVKSRSAASCGSALNTSALRLFFPDCFFQGIFRSWGTWWLLWSLLFLGDRVDIQVCLCLLYICLCWCWCSVQNLIEVFRLLCVLLGFCHEKSSLLVHNRSVSAFTVTTTHQLGDLVDSTFLPCLLHLLPGLQGRLCGSACVFLSSSSLFGSLPYIVACIALSVALIRPPRLSSWEFFCSQWLARHPLWPTSSFSSALFQGRLCRSARRVS